MRKSNHRKQTKNSRWPLVIGLFFFLAFGFLSFIFFKVATLDKFIYVNRTEVGDAEIILIDTKSDVTMKYLISGDVELESADGYGKYKLRNLWLLSEKVEDRGSLIADTIVKNYFLPVYLWKDGSYSNLSIFQKIKAKFVEKRISLNSEKLSVSDISKSISVNFSDPNFSENLYKIEVQDMTGDNQTIEKVSNILDVLGGKITTNSKGYNKEMDCEISSNNKLILQSVNNIFRCKIVDHVNNSVDLVIKLGVKFAERF